jgi:hypothetical protein
MVYAHDIHESVAIFHDYLEDCYGLDVNVDGIMRYVCNYINTKDETLRPEGTKNVFISAHEKYELEFIQATHSLKLRPKVKNHPNIKDEYEFNDLAMLYRQLKLL